MLILRTRIVFVPDLAQGKSNATVSEDAWTEFAQMLCPFKAKILVFTHGYRRDRHIPWDEFLHSSYHLRNELFRNVDQVYSYLYQTYRIN